jgi:pyruvate/2-oxoglutarate dehydrogenase complex dihydrolipoamide acyltransferase (E2) component
MVRTNSLVTTAAAMLTGALLQACGQASLAVTPVLRIDDARAMLTQQRASALPRQPAPATVAPVSPISLAAQRATLPVTPSRMEIVQLGPNEYRLQYRQQPAAASPAATASAGQDTAAPLQIVNGNGVRGMGERVRALLARQGIAASRVVNQRGHYQRTTIIEYLPGQQQRAADVQTALNGHAVLLPARALPDGLALRLVLGRDHVARLSTLAALAAPAARLAATAPLLSALDAPALPSFNQE